MHTEFLAACAGIVGAGQVLSAPADMAPYLVDWRGRYHGVALAVLRPGTTAEVAGLVRCCAAHGVAIVAQGGNTGLVGGATPLAEGPPCVVLSLGRLCRIRAIDVANDTVIAEAGCTLAALQQAAEGAGRLFPLSLAAEGSCTIGGNIATNAGGVQVLRYGAMRAQVLGLEVVLPDGQVWDGLRALRKDNTGYDLKQLFIGAEGTLGVVTAAVLALRPLPCERAVAWANVADVGAALRLMQRLRACFDERLSAFELVGEQALALVLAHLPGLRAPLATAPWSVLIELAGGVEDRRLAARLADVLGEAAAAGELTDATVAESLAQAGALWALREGIPEAQKREGFSIKHDIALPISSIPAFLAAAQAALAARWPQVRIVAFGHLGDGNLHYNLSLPAGADNAAFVATGEAANRIVHDLVAARGGSISAEHGLGQLKRIEVRRYKHPLELALMARIKAALDPAGLMNPGKLL